MRKESKVSYAIGRYARLERAQTLRDRANQWAEAARAAENHYDASRFAALAERAAGAVAKEHDQARAARLDEAALAITSVCLAAARAAAESAGASAKEATPILPSPEFLEHLLQEESAAWQAWFYCSSEDRAVAEVVTEDLRAAYEQLVRERKEVKAQLDNVPVEAAQAPAAR